MKALPISPSCWSESSSPPVMSDGLRLAPFSTSKVMAATVDLPLVPAMAAVRRACTKCASSSERCTVGRWRAARRGVIRDLGLDRGGQHHRRGIGLHGAAVLRMDLDAETFERGALLRPLPLSKARSLPLASPAHHLVLGERAHAAARDPT